jgi:hypothetical protein
VAREGLPFDVSRAGDEPIRRDFDAALATYHLGDVILTRASYDAQRFERTRRKFALDDLDHFPRENALCRRPVRGASHQCVVGRPFRSEQSDRSDDQTWRPGHGRSRTDRDGSALDGWPEEALEAAFGARRRIREPKRLHGAGLNRNPENLSTQKI